MKAATICFLLRDGKVCLGLKKRGFGVDKYNGFGGKIGDKEEFKDETVEESLIREGREEFGIGIRGFEKVGYLSFVFPSNPDWDQDVHVYICDDWEGEPKESEEMRPVWFDLTEIPYGEMWDDDQYWLPRVLGGKRIKAKFEFDGEGKVTKQEIQMLGKTRKSSERK